MACDFLVHVICRTTMKALYRKQVALCWVAGYCLNQGFLNFLTRASFFTKTKLAPSLHSSKTHALPPWQHKQKTKPEPYHILHFHPKFKVKTKKVFTFHHPPKSPFSSQIQFVDKSNHHCSYQFSLQPVA